MSYVFRFCYKVTGKTICSYVNSCKKGMPFLFLLFENLYFCILNDVYPRNEQGRNADTKRCCAREVTPKRSNPPERKFAIAEKICEKAGSERRNVIIP